MNGRTARKTRRPVPPVMPKAPEPAYRKAADVPEGVCWICGQADHDFLRVARDNGSDHHLDEPDVANAMWHVILAAFGPITERSDVHTPEWIESYTALSTAMGYFGGTVAHFARVAEFHAVVEQATATATREAIGVFWEELVNRSGEGTYQFEVRRNPAYAPNPRRVN